jgi:hypothetical protein
MTEGQQKRFLPPRTRGLLLHGFAALILFSSSITLFVLAMQEQLGTFFALFLIFSLILLGPALFVLYRTYALLRASYIVEREGVRFYWGLRKEEIPLTDIDWMQSAKETEVDLRLPLFSFPGAIIGHTHSEELGLVEFMASDVHKLILLGANGKVFAISPSDPKEFLKVFKQAVELGSISPIAPSSTLPATYLRSVWADKRARALIIAGGILAIMLLVVTSLFVPTQATVSLGFDPNGLPLEPIASPQLILLPVLSLMMYTADMVGALFFFRKAGNRVIAFFLWIGSLVTTMLLSMALVIILF